MEKKTGRVKKSQKVTESCRKQHHFVEMNKKLLIWILTKTDSTDMERQQAKCCCRKWQKEAIYVEDQNCQNVAESVKYILSGRKVQKIKKVAYSCRKRPKVAESD